MSSRAISGRPGGGKSYYAVKLLLRELFSTDRPIVTNLPLRLENIVKFCISKGREDIDVYDRIQILEDDQVPEFWRYRGNGVDPLPGVTNEEWKRDEKRPAFDQVKGPVCYFIDEAHDFLNSRNWMTTGNAVLFYISKHRHLGDDVFWITQAIANVDKQFRSVTQDYTYCRNYAKEKFRGFTKGKYFTATTYLEPVGNGPVKPDPQEAEKYVMEKEIGDCYFTSKQKLAADVGKGAKGLSIKWIFAGIALLCLLAIFLVWIGPKMIVGYITKPKVEAVERSKVPVLEADAKSVAESPAPLQLEQKPWHVLTVPLKESTATEAINGMKADGVTVPGIFVAGNAANNALVLTGDDMQKLITFAEVCRSYDVEAPLITVNCVVGRLVRGKGSKIGLYDMLQQSAAATDGPLSDVLAAAVYDFSTGIATFGTTIAARELLNALTDFQASNSRFEVVSRPTLTIVAGKSGEFKTGREIPVSNTTANNISTQTSVTFKQAEFSFKVRPTLRPDGWVRLEIEQSNADVLSTTQIDGNSVPNLSTQSLQTLIDLNPRQVAYLGGINIRTSRKDRRGVPLLRNVPGLNLVFGTTETTDELSELVILVSVDVHGRSEAPVRVLRALPVSGPSWSSETATLSGNLQPGTHNGQTKGKTKKGKK